MSSINEYSTQMNNNTNQVRSRMEMGRNLCEITLIADKDGQRISAHRNVLATKSDYFSAMFTCGLLESTQTHVTLENVHGDQLIPLVKYCYTGDISVTEENVEDLMGTASLLQFKEVEVMCASFLQDQLDPSNCLGLAAFAEQYYCIPLMVRANEYICEYFEEVYKNPEFLEMDANSLSKLIANSDLNVSSEECIFASVIAWIQHNPQQRFSYIRELLKSVRLPLLPLSYANNYVLPICRKYDCEDLLEVREAKARKGSSGLLALFSRSAMNGISIERYCPGLDQWRSFAEIPSPRFVFASAILKDQLLIIGGSNNDDDEILSTVECFDLETKILTQLAPMLTKRHSLGAAVVDGFVFAVGGISNHVPLNTVERYDPINNSWSLVAPMPVATYGAAVAALNGQLYVVGGSGVDGASTKTTQVYNPVQNTWTLKAEMAFGRQNFGVAVNKGHLYAVGGIISGYGIGIIECYDPNTNEWSEICDIRSKPCLKFCAFLSGDRLMTVCTKMEEGTKKLAVDEFNTKSGTLKRGADSLEDSQRLSFLGICGIVAMP